MDKRIIIGLVAVGVCFILGVLLSFFYQSSDKSMSIYSHALSDYKDKNFQNSYYLFSKISFTSKLKPYAIYHQAMCAKELGDTKSEMKQYQLLFNNYVNNVLSLRAKYMAAQLLIIDNPNQAKKYFEQIIKNNPNTEYALASEYYLAVIALNKSKEKSIVSSSQKDDIEKAFRHYLTKAPQGRLALNAITNWLSLNKTIDPDDYLLMAKTYYLYEDYDNAKKMLAHTDLKDSWVIDIKNSYALKNYSRAKTLAQYGLQYYTQTVDEQDIYDVVDIYLNMSSSKSDDISKLFEISAPRGKDYIWLMKCDATSSGYQVGCYKQLYLNFPNSKSGALAMSKLFFDKILSRDYQNAEKIGKDYLNRFSDTPSAPMVMFWLGKVAEYSNDYDSYSSYYKSTINKYPDSYYAYRAYLALKHSKQPILNASIQEKPVEYPYKNISKKDVIFKLVQLKDYDMLDLISDDEFVKSWVYYQKGEYSLSAVTARNAMDKLVVKPSKYDLRWRLVYPLHYYDVVKTCSNDHALMMSLIREESYFNTKATSAVGARGLMQLMPTTAKEIAGLNANDLYDPILNIKAGTNYYSRLKTLSSGSDILSVAAYNGGIGSISKWVKNMEYSNTDEFIEQIPYAETQNYVKKVYRTYWNYLRTYSK